MALHFRELLMAVLMVTSVAYAACGEAQELPSDANRVQVDGEPKRRNTNMPGAVPPEIIQTFLSAASL